MKSFTIDIVAIQWILLGMEGGYKNHAFGYAFVMWWDGSTWLVSTNGHRSHAYSLGLAPDQHQTVAIDLRRAHNQMVYDKAKNLTFDFEGDASIEKKTPLYAPLLVDVEFPDNKLRQIFDRCIWDSLGNIFAVDYKYLSDACKLADNNSVVITGNRSAGAPLEIRPNSKTMPWFAVIMPMRAETS